MVHFVAITQPPLRIEPLFDHDLNYKKHRIANLIHMIRLSGVVAGLGATIRRRDQPEYEDIMRYGRIISLFLVLSFSNRDNGFVRMSFGAGSIRKEFWHTDAAARVSKLVDIYKLLESKQVPNVDNLDHFEIGGNHPPHVHLSPLGIDRLPESGSESLDVVVCVLEALKVRYGVFHIHHLIPTQVMHSPPNPVYHRDIRGPNIIKRFDGPGWFLIDWSDACIAPTRAVTHLTESEHSPRVREDNHGAEVDMWGVGKYLEDLASRVTCGIVKPDAVTQMARKWMSDHIVSAVTALEEIQVYIHHLLVTM